MAASKAKCIATDVEWHVVYRADARSKRKCELRAGAKSGVTRNSFCNVHVMSTIDRQQSLQTLEITTRAFAVWSGHLCHRRSGNDNARTQVADRETEAAETSSKLAV